MPHLIKVTNHNDFTINEMYDGIPYVFAKDKPVTVPLEAMRHIFGANFPEDKSVLDSEEFRSSVYESVAKRFGWNVSQRFDATLNRWIMNGDVVEEGKNKFANLEFVPVIYKMVEVVADNPDLPVPRETKDPVKSQKKSKEELA